MQRLKYPASFPLQKLQLTPEHMDLLLESNYGRHRLQDAIGFSLSEFLRNRTSALT